MESSDFVFIFIQDELPVRTKRRIVMLQTALDQLNIDSRSPHEGETPLELIKKGDFKPQFLIINIEHPELDQILTAMKDSYPSSSTILLYPPSELEKLQKIQEKYQIKYDIEGNNINTFNLNNLFLKMRSDRAFMQKNQNTNQRYTLIQSLGHGASSNVDLYYDNVLNRKVAIKKIQVEGMKEIEADMKINKEVENMKNIKIPTSIEFYNYEIENDNRFIYMEYADKGTLDAQINNYLVNGGKFSTEQIFDYLCDIMLALFALNQKGMIHRDIKSENILLKNETINGENYIIAKLSDLGISRQIDGVIGSLTLCGTPYYVSPEIAAGKKRYDYNVDIWSLGVVLYEMVTLSLPWHDPNLYSQELFQLIFTTKYPPLPEGTDPYLKYLISIMLKKDPKRRANLTDILKLDFVYEKITQIIKKYNWEDIKDFQGIKDLEKDIKPCYLFLKLFTDEQFDIISDANKLCSFSLSYDYKPNFFGSSIRYAKKGDELLETFENMKKWKSVKLSYNEETPNNLLKKSLMSETLVPLSHKIQNIQDEEEVEKYVEEMIKNPSNYYFKSSVRIFENISGNIDNSYICNFKMYNDKVVPDNLDFLVLSYFILKQGKSLIESDALKDMFVVITTDKRYINFKQGISYFQECDIFQIPYDENNKDRLAFLLNVYQIMMIHHYFNVAQKNTKSKNGLLSYFQYNIGITYKFKNFTLNNLELKHVVFRNNKPVPGSYMKLLYQSDKKCTLLPNFDDLRPLLILNDLTEFESEDLTFKIFNEKEVDEQLNDITFKFIQNHMYYQDDELYIAKFIKPYLNDFSYYDTPENPKGFLEFLLKYVMMHRDFNSKETMEPYKIRISDNDMKNLDFFNLKFIIFVSNGGVKIKYV